MIHLAEIYEIIAKILQIFEFWPDCRMLSIRKNTSVREGCRGQVLDHQKLHFAHWPSTSHWVPAWNEFVEDQGSAHYGPPCRLGHPKKNMGFWTGSSLRQSEMDCWPSQ